MVSGLESNSHVQNIAASMILVGGIGVITNAYMMTLSAFGAPKLIAFVQITECIIFAGARFTVFPLEAIRLVFGLYHVHPGISSVCIIGFCTLSFFNIVIARLKFKKLMQTITNLRTPGGKKKILLVRQSSSTSWIAAGASEIDPVDDSDMKKE